MTLRRLGDHDQKTQPLPFMSLIIMNLMVGLAVDDISEVRKNAALQRIGMRTKTSLETEFNYLLNLFDMRKKTTRSFINLIPEEVEENSNSVNGLVKLLFSFFRSEHRLTTEVIWVWVITCCMPMGAQW